MSIEAATRNSYSVTLQKLTREAAEFADLLADPSVTDVMVNPDGRVWVQRLGSEAEDTGRVMTDVARMSFLTSLASIGDGAVTDERPIFEGELPETEPFDGARISGIVPPVSSGPMFAIRKQARKIFTLLDYEEDEILPRSWRELGLRSGPRGASSPRTLIEDAVRRRESIAVFGGTGAGKTTILNAVLEAIDRLAPEDRHAVIETARELQTGNRNAFFLRANETTTVDDLVIASLRLFPRRITMGEARGPEAYSAFNAFITGHPGGGFSMHSETIEGGLSRLVAMLGAHPAGARLSEQFRGQMIADGLRLVVLVSREGGGGRRIKDLALITGYRDGKFLLDRGN